MRPGLLLALFCCSTLLLFGDRGVISCNSVNGRRADDGQAGYGIQGEFDLSLSADGLLAAMLMTGLMLSAPTCAQLSRRFPALKLMGAGLSLWVAGAAGCALAPNFVALLLCRLVVGAACGPFIALAAPLVDEQAPQQQKSLWLAMLFTSIPTGFACGYIYGGLVGTALGWRAAFAIEAAAMVPLAAVALLAEPVELQSRTAAAAHAGGGAEGTDSSSSGTSAAGRALATLLADCRGLAASPVCLLTILALSVYNAALGCYAYWGPKAARDIFSLPAETADLLFGGITVLTGVLGTLCGGLALDSMGASVRNALLLCTGGVGLGCLLVMAGFGGAKTILAFAPFFAGGEYGLFIMAAPVNAALMWSVAPELRPFALSAAEFSQHLIGDIPSPPLLGWLQGRVENWRLTMCVCTSLLALSTALFCVALHLSGKVVRFREVVVEDESLEQVIEEAAGEEGGSCSYPPHQEARSSGGADADLEQPLLQSG